MEGVNEDSIATNDCTTVDVTEVTVVKATLTLTAPGVAVTDAVSVIPGMDKDVLVASEEENESVSKSWLLAERMVGKSEEGREEMLLLIDIEMDDNSDTMMLSDDVTMTSSEETIAVVGDRSRVDKVGDGSMES